MFKQSFSGNLVEYTLNKISNWSPNMFTLD